MPDDPDAPPVSWQHKVTQSRSPRHRRTHFAGAHVAMGAIHMTIPALFLHHRMAAETPGAVKGVPEVERSGPLTARSVPRQLP